SRLIGLNGETNSLKRKKSSATIVGRRYVIRPPHQTDEVFSTHRPRDLTIEVPVVQTDLRRRRRLSEQCPQQIHATGRDVAFLYRAKHSWCDTGFDMA